MAKRIYDVMVIGGGGAGLTAALYTSRANLSTILFEKLVSGGQIASTDWVENYPGFTEGVLGSEIAQKMEAQAVRYGTEIIYEEVKNLSRKGNIFEAVSTEASYAARAVILAMGASCRMIGVPNEKELMGKGVSYCATCDGAFFKGKKVIAVGGGDSALQEGIFLTRFAERVTIVHRRDKLRASPILQERAKMNSKISFIWDTVVDKIEGEKKVEAVLLRNVKTGVKQKIPTDGIFVFIGHDPNSGLAKGFVTLDEKGCIVTDASLATSVPGVFAAGEVRQGAVRQLVSACGEGCAAALAVQAFLDEHC
ncbi:MAG: thioredoxin-disulfide reductase [Omnitrophica bacterium RIFOXYB12_FULL_50_7]|nr:MAG: thioredoxin-disulfide reductase [Omnitrophica bacterium RIFOXYB12_FULL_50_7]